MAGQVIQAVQRFLRGAQVISPEERRRAEFKARLARIEAHETRAAAEWQAYFESGARDGADPVARAYHSYICGFLEKIRPSLYHPDHARACKAAEPLDREVRRLRGLCGLPKNMPRDISHEPPPPAGLAAAYAALAEAQAEVRRAAQLPKPEPATEHLTTSQYRGNCLLGWIAHALPERDFEACAMDLWHHSSAVFADRRRVEEVFEAARQVRDFPRLARALAQWPDLPFSYDPPTAEDLLRAEWHRSEPLVRDSDPMEKIEAVFAGFSADDLHTAAHGQDLYSAPFMRAIARHPLCDWASALEILYSFNAYAYQCAWAEGKAESDFDPLDRIVFEAFETIARRANGIGFRSRSFKTNFEFDFTPPTMDGKPNPYHPEHWVKWAIPARNLPQPEGKPHKPRVVFEGTLIRPSFEAWREARGA